MKPRIRATLQPHLFEHEGVPYILLRDPLGIAEKVCAVPQAIAPLLGLLDGTRDIDDVRNAFELRTGVLLEASIVEQVVSHLDEALLLDNDRFTHASVDAFDVFRSAPYRVPTLAGGAYPATGDALEDC